MPSVCIFRSIGDWAMPWSYIRRLAISLKLLCTQLFQSTTGAPPPPRPPRSRRSQSCRRFFTFWLPSRAQTFSYESPLFFLSLFLSWPSVDRARWICLREKHLPPHGLLGQSDLGAALLPLWSQILCCIQRNYPTSEFERPVFPELRYTRK